MLCCCFSVTQGIFLLGGARVAGGWGGGALGGEKRGVCDVLAGCRGQPLVFTRFVFFSCRASYLYLVLLPLPVGGLCKPAGKTDALSIGLVLVQQRVRGGDPPAHRESPRVRRRW